MMDINRLITASKFTICAYFLFNLLAYVAYAALVLFGFIGSAAARLSIISPAITGITMVLWLINLSFNFGILVHGGYRGEKQGLDMVSCGLVGMLSWSVVTPIIWFIEYVGKTVFDIGVLAATGVGVQALLALNTVGAIVSATCLFGVYLLGFPITFITSLIGGFFGSRK